MVERSREEKKGREVFYGYAQGRFESLCLMDALDALSSGSWWKHMRRR